MGERPIYQDYLMHRSNDEWWVGVKGGRPLEEGVYLKASVMEGDPNQPPTTGWKFDEGYDAFDEDNFWWDDSTLTCSAPSTSPPCCLTVSLSGAAKEAQGQCEGEYKSTGLVSMGREVFKLEGSSDFYLFVGGGRNSWAIWSNVEADKIY